MLQTTQLKIHLDFETYSDLDLKEVGVFKYSEDPSSEILLVGYSIGDGEVQVVEPFDPQLKELLESIDWYSIITAHNVNFEKALWDNVGVKKYGWPSIGLTQWRCTAARGRAMNLPNSLEDIAIALDLEVLKDKAGSALIRKYCGLDRKGNRVYLRDNLEDLEAFKNYCKRDVEVEIALDKFLPELSENELKVFQLDLIINDRGIPLDLECLNKSQAIIEELEAHFNNKAIEITGFKPTQRSKAMEWLKEKGLDLPNLLVETVEQTLLRDDIDPLIKEFLELRYEASRVGTKKAKKMLDMCCSDGTVKGSFLYHSASTGRWSSRGVQLQNMGRPESQTIQDDVINTIKHGTAQDLLNKYDRPLTAISKSMRGFIHAPKGYRLIQADFSSIEAKVLAWLSGEEPMMELYRTGADVYKNMASKIYDKSVEDVTGPERKVGKVTVLGCGYGMGANKFFEDCKSKGLDLTMEQAQEVVAIYRESVPSISNYWNKANQAARRAVEDKGTVVQAGRCSFYVDGKFLYFILPSGRKLAFYEPKMVKSDRQYNNIADQIQITNFYGNKKIPAKLWGGIIVQNLCQATARDMLVNGMFKAENNGYPIVMHVHDECVSMLPDNVGSLGDFMDQLTTPPTWALDFPLTAEGYEATSYRK